MKSYNRNILLILLVISFNSYAQLVPDTVKTRVVDNKAISFAIKVEENCNRVNKSNNLDTIKKISAMLKIQADTLIAEVKKAYLVNDEAIEEANTYYNLANSSWNTDMGASYYVIAKSKMQETGLPPDYLDDIKQIDDLMGTITCSNKIERIKRINNRLSHISKELENLK